MRKLTTQEFIDRARAVHGDKYGYAFSVYRSNCVKLTMICHEHGMFEQRPYDHLVGKGCPSCSGNKKHTNYSFVDRARAVHGDKYAYDMVEYTGAHKKITIVCPHHGGFEQLPSNHLRGVGCPDCADKLQRRTNEEFIEKAKLVHGENKYNYSRVKYLNSITRVEIICREHGCFLQVPTHHLKGVGCPGCAKTGFDRTRSASLYVLRSDCGRYMKIGITHNPKQRYNKLKRDTPFSFKRIELIEGPGDQIAKLEKELLAEYQQAEFTETFDGYSEWRLWDDSIRHKLISFMNKGDLNGPL
jgi:hypothetical protein